MRLMSEQYATIIKLMVVALLVSGIADYGLKYAADRRLQWLAAVACLVWVPLGMVWYKLYQLDKFMLLSAYYMMMATAKDIFISQAVLGEQLTRYELLGCLLIISGVLVISIKGAVPGG